ncbi:hypothetical protein FQN54_001144 [Arachnomyces sp. PD_36]|nr:hypothetical protein FQN54_001144 [Arachnomyces sp. PD_36]
MQLFSQLLLFVGLTAVANAAPAPQDGGVAPAASNYWISSIERQGAVPFGDGGEYQVFRNVKDFGAKGDGSSDDTEAINSAITAGKRCGGECDSSTTTPALVYFPPGTYVVSAPIVQYYYTQLHGDALDLPVLKAAPNFEGMAVIDADPYNDDGSNWYTNQNNFFRQIRNFVIDLTGMDQGAGAGIHWQVAQATSLQNIRFEMVKGGGAGNAQQGIFMDNGSGGFMADLTFNGGNYGVFLGNQQFTTRNLTFNGCNTAIYMNWNWAWTFKSVEINECGVGLNMSQGGNNQTVGSVLLLDSVISADQGIVTSYSEDSVPETGGTIIIDNVDFSGSQTAVAGMDGSAILEGGSVVASWAQGNAYGPSSAQQKRDIECRQETPTPSSSVPAPTPTGGNPECPAGPVSKSRIQSEFSGPEKPQVLMGDAGVFERTKPQYEDVDAANFLSVKSAGAKGDGKTDDTEAIQAVLDKATAEQVVYFDHGAYIITSTVKIPKNIRITGEVWPMIMASGEAFSDLENPIPMLQVGQPGDVGTVEISELMIETKGPAPGAILVEWNVAGESAGAAGMWDVHLRIGGSAGSELQSDNCAKTPDTDTTPNPDCIGAFMLMHITESGSGYFENNWYWVADHELDIPGQDQINLYNGRGVLIESKGPVWMYGTASEHNTLYNYQLVNAQNIYMALIQTESAYFQSNPDALVPFPPNADWNDPTFENCDSPACKKTWGLRVLDSTDFYLYGGGLYSFFENYEQTCLDDESCQENIIEIDCSEVYMYGVSTKASTNMITSSNGEGLVPQIENRSNFCSTIAMFSQVSAA